MSILIETSSGRKGCLSIEESARLAELEPIIELGMAGFVEVGNALLEISDRRLYRATHSTFKEYVEDKWKMSVRHAYRLCESAEIIKSLPEQCDQLVTSESQARELAKVQPEKRAKVLEASAAKGPITAKAIRVVAQRDDDFFEEAARALGMFEPDSKYIPPAGHSMTGYGDKGRMHFFVVIHPHVADGFFFVVVITSTVGDRNGGATMDFTKRAVRQEAIAWHLWRFLVPAESLTWETSEGDPRWHWNELAYDSLEESWRP